MSAIDVMSAFATHRSLRRYGATAFANDDWACPAEAPLGKWNAARRLVPEEGIEH